MIIYLVGNFTDHCVNLRDKLVIHNNMKKLKVDDVLDNLNMDFEVAAVALIKKGFYEKITTDQHISQEAYHYLAETHKNQKVQEVQSSFRLIRVLTEFNISLERATNYLRSKGYSIKSSPNFQLDQNMYDILKREFRKDQVSRNSANRIKAVFQEKQRKKEEAQERKKEVKNKKMLSELRKKTALNQTENKITIKRKMSTEKPIKLYNEDNISNNISIAVSQHRIFTVLVHKDNVTILQDKITKLDHPYKRLPESSGDNIILFIEATDSNNRFRFQPSVLNYFVEGGSYQFKLESRRENGFLLSYKNYFSFVPLSFGSFFENDLISLLVKNIDLNNNQLYFESPYLHQKDPNKLFEIGKTYPFVVTGSFGDENTETILLLDFNGFKATVRALPFQRTHLPSRVFCTVYGIEGDKVKLGQDRYQVLLSLYEEGKNYEFKIADLKKDENTDEEYFVLEDEFGLSHRMFLNSYVEGNIEREVIGTTRNFLVKKINERGHLLIYLNVLTDEIDFYDVHKIFSEIGFPDKIQSSFFAFRDFVEHESNTHFGFSNMFSDHQNRENLWVFSYLSFIDYYRYILYSEEKLQLAIELLNIYIGIEEWMLEGSAFLSHFSQEKKELIIRKGENRLRAAKYELESAKLVLENKGIPFLKSVNEKINRSGYLRADSLGVFKALLRIKPELLESNNSEIVAVLVILLKEDRIEKYEYFQYGRILEKRLAQEKYQLNFNLLKSKNQEFDSETQTRIKGILRLLALQIFLSTGAKNTEASVLKSATLLRYLSFISIEPARKKELLDQAVVCIVENQPLTIKLTDIDTIEDYSFQKEKGPESVKERFKAKLVFKYGGALYATSRGWALVSSNQNHIFQNKPQVQLIKNGSYFHDRIVIGGLNPDLSLTDLKSYDQYKSNWNQYFTYNFNVDETSQQNQSPQVGEKVLVRAKNLHKTNLKLLFVTIVDEKYSGEGVLHISQTSKIHFDNLVDLINPGEIFYATVIRNEDGKLSFSLIDQIWELGKNEFEDGKVVDGKIISIGNGIAFIINEQGLPMYTPVNRTEYPIKQNEIYKFKTSLPKEESRQLYLAEFVAESDVKFDPKRALRRFLEKYFIEEDSEPILEYDTKIFFKLIYELVLVIENLLVIQKEQEKKLELLYLAKFLTSVIKHHRSYFFDAQINFLLEVNRFKNTLVGEDFIVDNYVDSQTIQHFESLELINDYYKILDLFNKEDTFPDLVDLKRTTTSPEVQRLIHTVLAYNLLKQEFPDDRQTLRRTKNLIYSHIANEKLYDASELLDPLETDSKEKTDKPFEINLGRENKVKEFKTSFIFYAGNNSQDLHKQSSIILKVISGFLNQAGGTLYLGVNDNGEVVGLENDYKVFGNSDMYERTIRKHIVEVFDKGVNGSINFDFRRSGNKEFLAIQIPQYDEPVAFKNEFYQRQGNETRILKGPDLYKFFRRKIKSTNS